MLPPPSPFLLPENDRIEDLFFTGSKDESIRRHVTGFPECDRGIFGLWIFTADAVNPHIESAIAGSSVGHVSSSIRRDRAKWPVRVQHPPLRDQAENTRTGEVGELPARGNLPVPAHYERVQE